MSINCLPGGEMASVSSKTAPAVASAGSSSRALSEMVNDGVVATSSALLIGSFFWVGARTPWMLELGVLCYAAMYGEQPRHVYVCSLSA